jgi:hypothetical protein
MEARLVIEEYADDLREISGGFVSAFIRAGRLTPL